MRKKISDDEMWQKIRNTTLNARNQSSKAIQVLTLEGFLRSPNLAREMLLGTGSIDEFVSRVLADIISRSVTTRVGNLLQEHVTLVAQAASHWQILYAGKDPDLVVQSREKGDIYIIEIKSSYNTLNGSGKDATCVRYKGYHEKYLREYPDAPRVWCALGFLHGHADPSQANICWIGDNPGRMPARKGSFHVELSPRPLWHFVSRKKGFHLTYIQTLDGILSSQDGLRQELLLKKGAEIKQLLKPWTDPAGRLNYSSLASYAQGDPSDMPLWLGDVKTTGPTPTCRSTLHRPNGLFDLLDSY